MDCGGGLKDIQQLETSIKGDGWLSLRLPAGSISSKLHSSILAIVWKSINERLL